MDLSDLKRVIELLEAGMIDKNPVKPGPIVLFPEEVAEIKMTIYRYLDILSKAQDTFPIETQYDVSLMNPLSFKKKQ